MIYPCISKALPLEFCQDVSRVRDINGVSCLDPVIDPSIDCYRRNYQSSIQSFRKVGTSLLSTRGSTVTTENNGRARLRDDRQT